MATATICAELQEGYDLSCVRNFAKGYHQEAVFINFNDVDRTNSTVGTIAGASCDYTIQALLKATKSGIRIKLPYNGSTLKGWYDKRTSDKGITEYLHKVQILAMGVEATTKCKIDKLDHGLFIVAIQAKDGTIEWYGWENGLVTGDYTYDITDGGGGGIIPLQSKDTQAESMLPLVYKPQTAGNAIADFDSLFENA